MILSLDDIKGHLALTLDQTEDDWLLQGKLDAATSQIERMLGFGHLERFETPEAVPADLREAILQLAWYENREAVIERGAPLPFGVSEIVTSHRDWSF